MANISTISTFSYTTPQLTVQEAVAHVSLAQGHSKDVSKSPTSHFSERVLIWQWVVEFGQRLGINSMPAVTHWLFFFDTVNVPFSGVRAEQGAGWVTW